MSIQSSTHALSIPTPSLASALFAHEQGQQQQQHQSRVSSSSSSSSPTSKRPCRTGISILDRELGSAKDLFCAGRIVGFAGVGGLHATSRLMIHNLVATYLLDSSSAAGSTSKSSSMPTIFILEPPTLPSAETSLLQIYDLLSTGPLAAPKPASKRSTSKSISDPRVTDKMDIDIDTDIDAQIDRISLLPYFDLIGISQALTEITDLLSQPPLPPTNASLKEEEKQSTKILILRGLGTTLAGAIDPSAASSRGNLNLTQTAALLVVVLRQLRRLARLRVQSGVGGNGAGGGVLVLVEVGVEEVASERHRRRHHHHHHHGSSAGDNDGDGGDGNGTGHTGLILRSAFSSTDGSRLKFGLDVGVDENMGVRGGMATTAAARPGWVKREEERARAVLERLVEETMDALVVVHDEFGVINGEDGDGDEHEEGMQGVRDRDRDKDKEMHDKHPGERHSERGATVELRKCIVEILKDAIGDAYGEWAVWTVDDKNRG